MQNSTIYDDFRSIAGENVSSEEIDKYLRFGKGDLNLALNYYFNRLAKSNKNKNEQNAFAELMEGSRNMARVEKIVKELRADYSQPVKSAIDPKKIEAGINRSKEAANLAGGFTNVNNLKTFPGAQSKREEKKEVNDDSREDE